MRHIRPRRRSATRFVGQVAAWGVIVGVTASIAAAVAAPRLAGATPYAVLSGSMTPTYGVGALVVTRDVDPATLGVGDVVTYQLRSGEPQTATHRVVAVRQQLDGEREFITQGDANAAADPLPVRPVQIRGEVWYSVPYLGYAHTWLDPGQRGLAITVVAALLFGYAAVMLAGAARDRVRVRRAIV
ncbi:signal peptidase I [Aeromicrobium phragmitis]|uniref:Signal peptidase I n=1 Tax=Aeromicrobium phragmitis TaxID=2478914 RepID=A0A3L8PLG8_9ACTN|nr:signal peptidase I [Aeromicrobium phragmitis]RLV55583.1 signal peptidase I [Aeromicrobium phragmitis]